MAVEPIERAGEYDPDPAGDDYVLFQKAAGGLGSTRHTKIEDLPIGANLRTVTAHLTSAELLTLFSAPTVVVPAPGSNKALAVVHVFSEWAAQAVRYGPIILDYSGDPVPFVLSAASIASISAGDDSSVGFSNSAQLFCPPASIDDAALVLTSITDPVPTGPIVTSTVSDGGSGYTVGDTGVIDWDAVAAYVVDTVGGGGGVLTYHLTNDGDPDYLAGQTNLATTPGGAQAGGGSGFTLDVLSIPPADGDYYITVLYRIIELH